MDIFNVGISCNNMTKAFIHEHDFWQIILNLSGSGTNYLNGQPSEFGPGSIFICPPNTEHWKVVNEGFFQDIYLNFNGSFTIPNIKTLYFEDDSEKTIEKLFLIAQNVYHRKEYGYLSVVEQLAETICTILLGWDGKGTIDPRVDQMKNILIRNSMNPDFSANDALCNTGYCKDYLRKCFKKSVGMTPVEYLNHLRIDHSKKLLSQNTHPSFPITEIAYLSGYYNAEYFSKVFKDQVGMSPNEYKKSKLDK